MNTVINSIVQQERRQNKLSKEIERLKKLPDIITVHFMASNPTDTPSLRLDEESRTIMEKIRMSEYRDSVKFETRWATRASDILQALNETNPTIVHFSGKILKLLLECLIPSEMKPLVYLQRSYIHP